MPFGRYKGSDLSELANSYILWLLTIDLREPLRGAVAEEADYRGLDIDEPEQYRQPTSLMIQVDQQDVAIFRRIVDSGFRAMALQTHPDRGGETTAMARLNAVAASVRAQLEAAH
jgi:Putative quorum-sensing-regulated virulence factor